MDIRHDILRSIPSVNELLESPEISKLTDLYPRQLIVNAIREVLEDIRQSLTNRTNINEIAMSKEGKKGTESLPSFDERGQAGMVKDKESSDEKLMSQTTDLSPQKLFPLVQQVLQQKLCGIHNAINVTGIILHTGLGRAPLAEEATKQLKKILERFCTLELQKNQFTRSLRVGKLTIALLEASLRIYLEEGLALKNIPVLKLILSPLETI